MNKLSGGEGDVSIISCLIVVLKRILLTLCAQSPLLRITILDLWLCKELKHHSGKFILQVSQSLCNTHKRLTVRRCVIEAVLLTLIVKIEIQR
jgi:hypothetical protein